MYTTVLFGLKMALVATPYVLAYAQLVFHVLGSGTPASTLVAAEHGQQPEAESRSIAHRKINHPFEKFNHIKSAQQAFERAAKWDYAVTADGQHLKPGNDSC